MGWGDGLGICSMLIERRDATSSNFIRCLNIESVSGLLVQSLSLRHTSHLVKLLSLLSSHLPQLVPQGRAWYLHPGSHVDEVRTSYWSDSRDSLLPLALELSGYSAFILIVRQS